jgi:predicted ATP-dependent endonuclease of OLD family
MRELNTYKNSILLLDNPGLQLHPSGQKNLLSTLEELSKENQIIYTTHSPYLIDIEHLDQIRIVEKDKDKGTIIKEKYYYSNLDSIKPIRDSLGFTLRDSLFISSENIFVEGPSDKYILEGMFAYLRDSFEWDSSKLSFNSAGGANKISYFAHFIASEGLKLVVVLDNDDAGNREIKELKKNSHLNDKQIIKLDQIKDIKDITIEDLININFYHSEVIKFYKSILKGRFNFDDFTVDKLDYQGFRMADKYNRFFHEKNLGSFDKIQVALQIKKDLEKKPKPSEVGEDTIDIFKKMFALIKEGLNFGADEV